jgi:hypothetical protein
MKTPRTKAQIQADPRVEDFWHEPENDCYWVYLHDKWISGEGTSAICERTILQIVDRFSLVELRDAPLSRLAP